MATTTSGNLHLTKPAYADGADIATINSNMDTIDTAVTGLSSSLTNLRLATLENNMYRAASYADMATYIYDCCQYTRNTRTISINSTTGPFKTELGQQAGTLMVFHDTNLWQNHPSFIFESNGIIYQGTLAVTSSSEFTIHNYATCARTSDLVTRVKVVDSGIINANSSHTFTCTNFCGYRLTTYSIGTNNQSKIVLFGKHSSVSDIKMSVFGCDSLDANAPSISVSGSVLTITTSSNNNCYYCIEKIYEP